jgi:hypothetical protein
MGKDDTKLKEVLALVSCYEIPMDVVFDHKQIRESFHEHLKYIHNEDPFLFLVDLEQYVTLIGVKARYNLAKKIVSEYLNETAPKAINVGSNKRQEVLDSFAKATVDDCPKDMFDAIRLQIYMELKQDCLPVFASSKPFLKVVRKELETDPNFLETIGTKKALEDQVDYSAILDANKMEFTEEDFEQFHREIRNELGYDLLKSTDTWSVSMSKQAFKNGLKVMKEVGVVDFTTDECINTYTDANYMPLIDQFLKDMQSMDFKQGPRYATNLLHVRYRMPFLMSNRDFAIISSIRREKNGSYMYIGKSVETPIIPPMKGYIRGTTLTQVYFEKISDTQTRYYFVMFCDLQGYMGATLLNKIISFRDQQFLKGLTAALTERRKLNVGAPYRSYRIYETLEHEQKMNKS